MRAARSRAESVTRLISAQVELSPVHGSGANVTGGVAVPSQYARDLPVVLVPIFGMLEAEVDELLQILYSAQSVSMGFRPVLFSDQNIFARARPYGWVVEHITSERDFVVHGFEGDWISAVIRRAQLATRFFGAAAVLLPDALSHNRNLLVQVQALTGTNVDSLGVLRGVSSLEEQAVVGWRGWLDRVSGSEGRFIIVSPDGQRGARARRGSAGSTLLIESSMLETENLSSVLGEALKRDWSYIIVERLEDSLDVDLHLMIGALLDGLTADGTLLAVTQQSVSLRLASLSADDRVVVASVRGGELEVEGKPFRLSDAELKTLVYRASRALVGSSRGSSMLDTLGGFR